MPYEGITIARFDAQMRKVKDARTRLDGSGSKERIRRVPVPVSLGELGVRNGATVVNVPLQDQEGKSSVVPTPAPEIQAGPEA